MIKEDDEQQENSSLQRETVLLADEPTIDYLPNLKKSDTKQKALELIKKISIGQYRTPLYYQRSDSYSSLCGGLLTLLLILTVLVYAIVILNQIVEMKTYSYQ